MGWRRIDFSIIHKTPRWSRLNCACCNFVITQRLDARVWDQSARWRRFSRQPSCVATCASCANNTHHRYQQNDCANLSLCKQCGHKQKWSCSSNYLLLDASCRLWPLYSRLESARHTFHKRLGRWVGRRASVAAVETRCNLLLLKGIEYQCP